MPDSILLGKKPLADTIHLDSVNVKLNQLSVLLTDKSSSISELWIPLLSAIIGGLLVWVGQAIERNRNSKAENRKNLLDIYSYCRKLEVGMKNLYRDLSLAKSHVEYWWYCYQTSASSDELHQKYYHEHLRCQSDAREIERKIGDTKAEFIGHVRKFQAIVNLPPEIETRLENISNLQNAKAKKLPTDVPYEKVKNELQYEFEQELRNSYFQNLDDFKLINQALYNVIRKQT